MHKNKFNKTNSQIMFLPRDKKRSPKLNNKAALKTELKRKPKKLVQKTQYGGRPLE